MTLEPKIWYALEGSTILERVKVIQTIFLPPYGRYIFYSQIDWPDSANPVPHCCHEDTFKALYTPQEEGKCVILRPENWPSKISSPQRPPFFTGLLMRWKDVISRSKKIL